MIVFGIHILPSSPEVVEPLLTSPVRPKFHAKDYRSSSVNVYA